MDLYQWGIEKKATNGRRSRPFLIVSMKKGVLLDNTAGMYLRMAERSGDLNRERTERMRACAKQSSEPYLELFSAIRAQSSRTRPAPREGSSTTVKTRG